MPDLAVELKGVSKVFAAGQRSGSELIAVHSLDLEIRCGEFFTLLGPSGCGKTTTLRLIAGFELPTSGEITIQGRRVEDVPPHLRPVNTVFQSYALFPHLTVGDNVGFGLAVKRVKREERRQRVIEALALVRMDHLIDRKPSALSGGQQQRVALARALINRPAVLLLDEPLGALDLKLRKEMQIELKHMQRQLGITFIFVTHDQEEALTMSDRIAVMNKGKLLQLDDPVGIYERPTTTFGAGFIGDMNFLQARVLALGPKDAVLDVAGQAIKVPVRADLTIGQSVSLAIRPEALSFDPIDGADPAVTLPGVLGEETYIGTDRRFLVQLTRNGEASGESLSLRVQNAARYAQRLPKPGEACMVHVLARDILVLTE